MSAVIRALFNSTAGILVLSSRHTQHRMYRSFTLFKNTSSAAADDFKGKDNITAHFLKAMRNVPSSVVVVTTGASDIKRGITCSSFTSVSSVPPIVSFCIMQPSRMDTLLMSTRKFVVHVLSEKQIHHSIHFSKKVDDHEEQFADISHSVSKEGCPILPNCTSVLHCSAHSVHTVGDHHVWYGGVEQVTHSNETPLLYYSRSYRSVGDQTFMQSFETATLAYEDWTHEAHLRMAWNYLTAYKEEEAIPLIKEGIKKYNEKHSHKIKRGYHETVTCFFIHIISKAVNNTPAGTGSAESFEEFLKLNKHLTDSNILFNYYSRESINSKIAKEQFVEPDIKPLPLIY